MGGEDRADIEFVDYVLQDLRTCLTRDFGNGLGQPAVLLLPGPQPPHPVDLFGSVAEVEVESESADQVGCLLQRLGGEQFADLGYDVVRAPRSGGIGAATRRFLGLLGQQADLLHQLQQFGTVLPDQRLAQQG